MTEIPNVTQALKIQREVEQIADVWYQIYYEKSTFSKFWQERVWDKIQNENL